MKRAFVAAAIGLAAAAVLAQADADLTAAAALCEADVNDTLQRLHGTALRGVRFDAPSRTLTRGGGDGAALRGNGRYTLATGGAAFQYSCAVNLQSGETSGAVVRDISGAAQRTAAAPSWEPDLARVSPTDCEAAVAALLTDRNPRVARIAFDAETRKLEPGASQRTALAGQGALTRATGMLAAPFSYRCEFDGRSGKIMAIQASD